ncbi:sensor histidine kinase [Dactylosporangium matsuzakiense]|uniref:Two-component sensor histidine kinase n=1 Tax=Dactylosporangium matsuzakiense TaxID=53360 RepID=A0A9W6KJM2_9ACTN|nr:sensor histidine kinase [Dactylosporangium matsuzakiense]UWZ43185.1 sensor histidine kinase [Dactylosporangium matsuzakiense]GLL02723.1 two-component sensor histidine kinase [Dactylosporangium matsuzakiense]
MKHGPRPTIGGMVWVAVWLFPLIDPLSRVTSPVAVVGLIAFAGLYVYTAALGFESPVLTRRHHVLYGAVAALGIALTLAYGDHWLIVMLYVSAAGMALYAGAERPVAAVYVFFGGLLAQVALAFAVHADWWRSGSVMLGTILSSLLCGAVRQMGRLITELRTTRQALADTAVAEERLRFSRDLHDLLGHTLSVIVVKAEVVRRIAERDPAAAAAQAADIEQVGRHALVEIREAVTGYRETGLTAELARAKGSLTAAGITADVLRTADPLPDAADRLLAWVVREATTNVIRHSGAANCEISLAMADGTAILRVQDDGDFSPTASAPPPGNGLRGLTERLATAGGTLETAPRPEGGLALTARLPL